MLGAVIAGLELRSFVVPPVGANAARWPLNDDRELIGYRAGGLGWLTIPGVATYRFADTGDVEATSDGAGPVEIEDAFVRSVLPLVVQARGTQVLHASAIAAPGGVVALAGLSDGRQVDSCGRADAAWTRPRCR